MEQNGQNGVVIMLGSNIGDRKAVIDKAVEAMRAYVDITTVSDDIDNPDFTGCGPDYLNRLLSGTTSRPFPELKDALKNIETRLGRDRSTPGLVAIDIDIVVYGDRVVKPSEYTSPPCQFLLKSIKLHGDD